MAAAGETTGALTMAAPLSLSNALTCRADARARLGALLAERTHAPFAWGCNDCALLACDAVEALTGVDVGYDLRGRYHSAAGAVRALALWLEERGVFVPGLRQDPDALLLNVVVRICLRYGLRSCDLAEPLQAGDVVWLRCGGPAAASDRPRLFHRALGVVALNGQAVTVSDGGMFGVAPVPYNPTLHEGWVERAWRVQGVPAA